MNPKRRFFGMTLTGRGANSEGTSACGSDSLSFFTHDVACVKADLPKKSTTGLGIDDGIFTSHA